MAMNLKAMIFFGDEHKKVSKIIKIGTRSVHVGSLCEVSQDTPNYNCTSLRIMTMSNTHGRNFAVYGQTQANCNIFFL